MLTTAHCLRDLADKPTGPWPNVTKGTFWLQYQNQEGAPFKMVCGAVNSLSTLPGNFAAMKTPDKDNHDFSPISTISPCCSPTAEKCDTCVMPYTLARLEEAESGYATRVGWASDILNSQIVRKIVEHRRSFPFADDAIPMLDGMVPSGG